MKMLLVLTFKGSLGKWAKAGILRRELEVYVEHLARGHVEEITVFTYGSDDAAVLAGLDVDPAIRARFRLLAPRRRSRTVLGHLLHSVDVPAIRRAVAAGCGVVKTNQINGAWTAWIARACGARFLLRCGYLLSRRFEMNRQPVAAAIARLIEGISFRLADAVSVTTADARADVLARLPAATRTEVHVAPTYVNTDLFAADVDAKPASRRFVYVGRLEPQKNVLALVEAAAVAGVPLTVVGDGSLREPMLARAAELGTDLVHHRLLDNDAIAALYRETRLFVLPSLHEGLPKVLIEAMSAEMICVGTPTGGTTDLIEDGVTGHLAAGFSAADVAAAMTRALDDPRAPEIARAARRLVVERHSIAGYAAREYEEICAAVARHGGAGRDT
jgi:glycosyltransferase involved in cell wall biosynthesis